MRAAWLDIDLDAYRSNLRRLGELCGTAMLAVVKANAYGHGLIPTARAAIEAGAWGLGVAVPEEGFALREAGIRERILVLGLSPIKQSPEVVVAGLDSVASSDAGVAALSEAARRSGARAAVHVKVDTGMCRIGIEPARALALCQAVRDRPELELAGVMTHFASADTDLDVTAAQWSRFESIVQEVSALGEPRPLFHAANSAAALWFPPARQDLIRPGLISYGVPPGDQPLPFVPLPALSLRAKLTQLKWIDPGARVGYGGTFRAERRTLLGLVPLGYGDGLPWRLAGNGQALVRGRRVPIVGRISMDQLTLDLTDTPVAELGDVATFIGRDGTEEITASNLAVSVGTIPYEILTGLAARLPRRYAGKIQ